MERFNNGDAFAGNVRVKERGLEYDADVTPAGPNEVPMKVDQKEDEGPEPACVPAAAPTDISVRCVAVESKNKRDLGTVRGGRTRDNEFVQAMRSDAEAQELLVPVLGRVLDATIKANAAARSAGDSALPHFESTSPCPLLPSAYLARMLRYTAISPCNLLVGIMYLQRLKDQESRVLLTAYNCQRLLLCSNMLASKMFDDKYVSNKQWAAVGDLATKELNALEVELLGH